MNSFLGVTFEKYQVLLLVSSFKISLNFSFYGFDLSSLEEDI